MNFTSGKMLVKQNYTLNLFEAYQKFSSRKMNSNHWMNLMILLCTIEIYTVSTGGRVLLAIKKCFNYSVIPITDNSFEMLVVKVMVHNNILLFGVVIIVQSTNTFFCSDLEKNLNNMKIWI